MVKLFKIRPLNKKYKPWEFKEIMRHKYRKNFTVDYNKKIKPNLELIDTFGELLFGKANMWVGLCRVSLEDDSLLVSFRDEKYTREYGVKRSEIISSIRSIIQLMELYGFIEIMKDYEKQEN